MKNKYFLVLSIFFALLQGPLISPVFIEGLLVSMLISTNTEMRINTKVLASLFLGGLIFDLVQDTTLGMTSLIFGISALILHYMGKSGLKNHAFWGAVASLITIIRGYVLWQDLFWVSAAVCGILTFVYFKFVWQGNYSGKIT